MCELTPTRAKINYIQQKILMITQTVILLLTYNLQHIPKKDDTGYTK